MFVVVQVQLALKQQTTLTDIWSGVFWKRNVKFKEIENDLRDILLKFYQGKCFFSRLVLIHAYLFVFIAVTTFPKSVED